MKKKVALKLKRFWQILGPGLVTGASDDDPSGIATYSQAGAQFGLSTLWTAFITFPLMASIQEMCARIGIVTSMGLTGTLKKNYPRPILYLMVIFSFPAIVLNIGADIAGMGAVARGIIVTRAGNEPRAENLPEFLELQEEFLFCWHYFAL